MYGYSFTNPPAPTKTPGDAIQVQVVALLETLPLLHVEFQIENVLPSSGR